jgi:hypothetical protein
MCETAAAAACHNALVSDGAMNGRCAPLEVSVEATFALRRKLLRADRPDLPLRMSDDDVAGAFHLAVLDEAGRPAGVTTLAPSDPPFDVLTPAYRLRQMAVELNRQGEGIGARLFLLPSRGCEPSECRRYGLSPAISAWGSIWRKACGSCPAAGTPSPTPTS